MINVDLVYVVLTYKNVEILYKFIESLKNIENCTYSVIIVNSYYNETSKNMFHSICCKNGFDFINIENKGYGYGNNVGFEYALQNYTFRYVVLSNPDVIVNQFDYKSFNDIRGEVIAPRVLSNDGKDMNPLLPFHAKLSEWFLYHGFRLNNSLFINIGIFMNKINKKLFHCFKKNRHIFACHGCFFLIPYDLLMMEGFLPLFDEQIFLNCEESDIAMKLSKMKIKIIYSPNIIITHIGQQSKKNNNKDESSIYDLKNSFIYYYEKWSD